MDLFTWILTPDITDIDINNLHNYGCYDEECLISTFYIDEMLDFLDENNIKVNEYVFTKDFQYKFSFNINKELFNDKINNFINFKTGRFKTSSIYIKTDNNAWVKIYKKGVFYKN